jgi:photosystem II stability/assembly factor-like uncharacterized protein
MEGKAYDHEQLETGNTSYILLPEKGYYSTFYSYGWNGFRAPKVEEIDGEKRIVFSAKADANAWSGGFISARKLKDAPWAGPDQEGNGDVYIEINTLPDEKGIHHPGHEYQFHFDSKQAKLKPYFAVDTFLEGGAIDTDPQTWQKMRIPYSFIGIDTDTPIDKFTIQVRGKPKPGGVQMRKFVFRNRKDFDPETMERKQTPIETSPPTVTRLDPQFFPPVHRGETWTRMPLVNQDLLDQGYVGGEGCQWLQGLAIDGQDGDFLLLGVDVAGVLRSTNGGRTWEPANEGYHARGNVWLAIDPKNNQRAVAAAGTDSEYSPFHGLYLTTNQAESWKHVLGVSARAYRDFRRMIVYDTSSYDQKLGYTKRVYWASYHTTGGIGRLYISEDGGETWTERANTSHVGMSWIDVNPDTGDLYVAGEKGFFTSVDHGNTFQKMKTGIFTGLAVNDRSPEQIFVTTNDELFRSDDGGVTFESLPVNLECENVNLSRIATSPLDPQFLMIDNQSGDWDRSRYYSYDSGKTFHKVNIDAEKSFIPTNARQGLFVFHPTDENIVFSFGGDFVTRSTDKGKTFHWYNDGSNLLMIGGAYRFNSHNPDLIFVGSQDYNGAYSTDGGRTWTYAEFSGEHWGGWNYGAYMASETVLFGGYGHGWSGPRQLKMSTDGGRTFHEVEGVEMHGHQTSYSDPLQPDVLFAFEWRSADMGETWTKMSEVEGVFTSNPTGKRELYGANKTDTIYRSFDAGETWEAIYTHPEKTRINDIDIDHVNQRLYLAMGDGLWALDINSGTIRELTDRTPPDQLGSYRFLTVSVDPVNTNIVYAGNAKGYYKANNSIIRSLDAGETWHLITAHKDIPDYFYGLQGGTEPVSMRVHPETRELHVALNCYGMWRFTPPEEM